MSLRWILWARVNITIYLSEYNSGIVAIKIKLSAEEVEVLNFKFIELDFSAINLAKPSANNFLGI